MLRWRFGNQTLAAPVPCELPVAVYECKLGPRPGLRNAHQRLCSIQAQDLTSIRVITDFPASNAHGTLHNVRLPENRLFANEA